VLVKKNTVQALEKWQIMQTTLVVKNNNIKQ
jgi:hypothetical protein